MPKPKRKKGPEGPFSLAFSRPKQEPPNPNLLGRVTNRNVDAQPLGSGDVLEAAAIAGQDHLARLRRDSLGAVQRSADVGVNAIHTGLDAAIAERHESHFALGRHVLFLSIVKPPLGVRRLDWPFRYSGARGQKPADRLSHP